MALSFDKSDDDDPSGAKPTPAPDPARQGLPSATAYRSAEISRMFPSGSRKNNVRCPDSRDRGGSRISTRRDSSSAWQESTWEGVTRKASWTRVLPRLDAVVGAAALAQ